MKDFFDIFNNYITGKPIYKSLRRLLNLVFNINITYYIYTYLYGAVDFNRFYDYKTIVPYIIKGEFVIPFSIYLVVYSSITGFSSIIFICFNHFKSIKLQRRILEAHISKSDISLQIEKIQSVSEYVSPYNLNAELLNQAYNNIKKRLDERSLQQIEKELEKSRNNCQENFIFLVRLLISIMFIKIHLPYFGTILFCLSIIVIIVAIILTYIYYQFLDLIPTLLRKFHIEAENYLVAQFNTALKT